MLRVSILFTLMLTACGSDDSRYIDPALQPGVDRYLANAPDSGHWDQLDGVEFGELPDTQLGECRPYHEQDRLTRKTSKRLQITISDTLKPRIGGSFLQAVVAHELAHCLHDREHSDSGLMLKDIQSHSDAFWDERLDEMIQDLFR